MTKLDIYGGLLGAGKTTLIKAMLPCAYRGKKTAVIENEIGRVNLDAGEFSGITVRPLTAGCVCCTLKGDLVAAVRELVLTEAPEYIVMEASGAADLDAIRRICEEIDEVSLNRCIMVVNARKLRKLMTVVGEFYRIQLREATEIYLNFTENLPGEELIAVKQLLRELNPDARVIDTPPGAGARGFHTGGLRASRPGTRFFPPDPGRSGSGAAVQPRAERPARARLRMVILQNRCWSRQSSCRSWKDTLYRDNQGFRATHRESAERPPAKPGTEWHLARQGICDDVRWYHKKNRLRIWRFLHIARHSRRSIGSRRDCSDRRKPSGPVRKGA
jgi:hypothetical protein